VADPASVRQAFEAVGSDFGRVDFLFNVAGVATPTSIADATDADIAAHVNTNLLAPIYTTRAAIPLLEASGAGDIVNVSSEVTTDLFPLLTLYGTAKAGLEMFSRAMTKELRPHRIRVTLFICGQTDTAFGHDWSAAQVAAAQAAWAKDGCQLRVSGGRQMEPTAVAEAMVFAVTRPRGQMVDIMQVRSL
jgi:NAD(P)-dependent dehydrogenase (short-subunit alcohol dehydrogenase family)